MNCINMLEAKNIISQGQKIQNIELLFQNFKKKYSNRVVYHPPHKIQEKIYRVNETLQQQLKDVNKIKQAQTFSSGERKIFNWIVTVYCQLHELTLEKLTEQHFEYLSGIFEGKEMQIKYQVQCLINKNIEACNYPVWTNEEKQILALIVQEKKKPRNWREISFEIFCLSKGLFYRHSQDCKQYWYNNLSPTIQRERWTIEEDIALLIECRNCNCNWKKIREQMGEKRTERKLKARFKEILKKFKLEGVRQTVKQAISEALNLLKLSEDSRKQKQNMRTIQIKRRQDEIKRQSQNISQAESRSDQEQDNYIEIRNNLEAQQLCVEQCEFDADYENKCLTDIITRSEQMQKLMFGDSYRGYEDENQITFLCSVPSHFEKEQEMIQNLGEEVMIPFNNEWLNMVDEYTPSKEESLHQDFMLDE